MHRRYLVFASGYKNSFAAFFRKLRRQFPRNALVHDALLAKVSARATSIYRNETAPVISSPGLCHTAGMSAITVPGKSPDIMPEKHASNRKAKSFSRLTPLMRMLGETHLPWFVNHLSTRYETLYGNLASWREKMAKYERMSEENYDDRKGKPDEVNPSSLQDIFSLQNETLGTVAGFYDFHLAQAKDDIFGTRPWLGATPEGKEDDKLADTITKHAQWKFNQSDIEDALMDAIKVSTYGGTAFIKASFLKVLETYQKPTALPYETKSGTPITNPNTGEIPSTAEELAEMGFSEEQVEWKVKDVDDVSVVYSNVTNALIDYKDIAFETTAPELSLLHTDVFVRFRMGLYDLMERYGIGEEKKKDLMAMIHGHTDFERDHRDESKHAAADETEENANPMVQLVEGFVRCSVKPGQVSRVHVIFSPDLQIIFAADYLANVTPGGILPIFPVRINRIAGRIFGKGYFEKYESANNAIDRQYNLITYRNRINAHVWTAINEDAIESDAEGEDIDADPTKPLKLKPDKKIDDAISFAAAPDTNSRGEMLLNSQMQMIQMRSGITSAAQGELKGVPSASTATGTRDLQSRGATIVKCPISEQVKDITRIVEYDVILLYANQDTDETFTWGEGREAELMEIKADDVLGLRANVTLTLTQSQNQWKLEMAKTAVGIVGSYIQTPEMEKQAVRQIYVQALSALGFHNAEDIIRVAVTDPEGILALVPPDVAPIIQQALVSAGVMAA